MTLQQIALSARSTAGGYPGVSGEERRMAKYLLNLAVMAGALAASSAYAQVADVALINGKIYTADAGDAVVTALADRKSVVEGKSVAVSVALDGRRTIKKKKEEPNKT